MKKAPRKLMSLLLATMVCAAAPTTALAAKWEPTDLITISVDVFDCTTQRRYANIGTDTITKGENHVVSDVYVIPELSTFTEEPYDSVQKVTGNWHGSVADCNVGSEVVFSCNQDSAQITYWVNSFGVHICTDQDGDGFCDERDCGKCLHDHDEDGYCTADDCQHPCEGSDACCPQPGGEDLTGKVSKPGMDKKAEGKESIGTVRPDQTIAFTLHSNVPQELSQLAKKEDKQWKLDGTYSLVFHDTMSSNLKLDADSVSVQIGQKALDSKYYTVATQDIGTESFVVSVNLVAAFNEGKAFTWEDMGKAEVVVSYTAAVANNTSDGDTVRNEAYVNQSKSDAVVGKVEVEVDDTPSTGGAGTVLYTVTGAGVMSAAAALYLVRRKRCEG